jgi:hypothetical protein
METLKIILHYIQQFGLQETITIVSLWLFILLLIIVLKKIFSKSDKDTEVTFQFKLRSRHNDSKNDIQEEV